MCERCSRAGKGGTTMKRRQFLSLLGGAATGAAASAWPLRSWAANVARVGIIDDGSDWEPFHQEMRELNYVQGRNIAFEYRRTDGVPDRLTAAAEELTVMPGRCDRGVRDACRQGGAA